MPITVKVHDYKSPLSPEMKVEFGNIVKSTIISSRTLEKIDVYNLAGTKTQYTEVNSKRLVIMLNSTLEQYSDENTLSLDAPEPIFGIETNISNFLPAEGLGFPIISENGIIVAEFHKERGILLITFDIANSINAAQIFMQIIKRVDEQYEAELNVFSWIKGDKSALRAQRADGISRHAKEEEDRIRSRHREAESNVEEYKQSLARNIRLRDTLAVQLEGLEGFEERILEKFFNDVDLVCKMEKVRDVRFMEDGLIHVLTVPLYITDDKDRRFYGGNYRITIDINNTNVRFFGDNPRQGHWTSTDPHPHVSGSSGKACLGNVDSTIAELCAQYEFYALVNVLIDFLEAANTGDVAGRKVRNWDRVDEEGNILPPQPTCKHCDSEEFSTCVETGVNVCPRHSSRAINAEGVFGRIDDNADQDDYTWNDDHEVYVHNDFEGDIEEVMENV